MTKLVRTTNSAFKSLLRFYRAASLKEFGKPLEIVDAKEPHISPKEVLLKVKSAGVNYSDLAYVRGKYHLRPLPPFVPGFEVAGEIEYVGKDVKNFSVGDRVVGLKTISTGAFAEKCAIKASELYKIPHSLSYEIAASLPTAYGSAYLALNELARASEGETILVITSQGAGGIAAIDLALNVFRCQVIVASDSEQKLQEVRPGGVLATLDYKGESLVKHVSKCAKDGVDIILDTVGGPWFDEALNCLKPGGRILCLNFTSGQVPKLDLQNLMKHGASVYGVSLAGLADNKPEIFHSIIETIVGFLDAHYIVPYIGAKFSLNQVNEALSHIDKNSTFGKVILNMS